ncbi:hypothetical protein OROHE_010809 [Orobanche hederae]
MAQEEHIILGCASKSKKIKQKKTPQRGLGVAQLEKIISEQQQQLYKQEFPTQTTTTPFLPINYHNFRPPSLCPSVPNIEIWNGNSSDVVRGVEIVSDGSGLSPRHENWPKSWNNHDEMTCRDLVGFEPHVKLAYESNAPNQAQRSHQFQRPPPCSLLVRSSSGISSVISNHTELPSIQSFHGKNYASIEENKMIGMKRSYPFSLENPPSSSLQRHVPPSHAISLSTSDEHTLHMEPRNKFIRESVSNSSPPERNPNELTSDHLRLNGDFLTLAPPEVASPPSNWVHKHISDRSGQSRHELSQNECIRGQDHGKSQIRQTGPSGSVENTFSFFPVKLQTYQTTAYISNGNGGKGETIDLNLKL